MGLATHSLANCKARTADKVDARPTAKANVRTTAKAKARARVRAKVHQRLELEIKLWLLGLGLGLRRIRNQLSVLSFRIGEWIATKFLCF